MLSLLLEIVLISNGSIQQGDCSKKIFNVPITVCEKSELVCDSNKVKCKKVCIKERIEKRQIEQKICTFDLEQI